MFSSIRKTLHSQSAPPVARSGHDHVTPSYNCIPELASQAVAVIWLERGRQVVNSAIPVQKTKAPSRKMKCPLLKDVEIDKNEKDPKDVLEEAAEDILPPGCL